MEQKWDPVLYEEHGYFVYEYGEDLLALLQPKKDEYIVDVGCGTGQITEKIARSGVKVKGIDASAEMIKKATENYPNITFEQRNAMDIDEEEVADAVFSNAALHWMKEQDTVIENIYRYLKPGGRFIGEMGAKGNIETIIQALQQSFQEIGRESDFMMPWYFPSIGEYSEKLEKGNFKILMMIHFKRKTKIGDNELSVRYWLLNFAYELLLPLTKEEREEVIQKVIHKVQPLFETEKGWFADYERLRFIAIK
ncbi:class I SAM-dependent methyltransferase [Massilibacterium senegalense]|uniref:class I SAM-dependent methyltransferase n=1 Tax=Massilibacterium senegalense TaxID=1632858 RepID=UPI0007848DAA|nr:class I SAM-dependent methyltransferase [Massilibacterium senegalense]